MRSFEMAGNQTCLRIAELPSPPYSLFPSMTPPLQHGGMMVEVYAILLGHLGFCYELIMPEDFLWGQVFPNGTISGILGMVQRNEVDIGALMAITEERKQVVQFSEPLIVDEYIICYKRPKLESDIIGFIKPLTHITWLALLGSLVLVTIFLDIIFKGNWILRARRGENNKHSPSRHQSEESYWSRAFLLSLSLLLSQAVPKLPRGNSLRLMTGLWLLVTLIVSSVYRSNLKAMLILPRVTLPFNNLMELAESKIPVFVVEGNYGHKTIMNSPDNSRLGAIKHQMLSGTDPMAAIRDVNQGLYAGTAWFNALQFILDSTFSKTGECHLYAMEERFLKTMSIALSLAKNSTLAPRLNKAIRGLKEFGLIQHILDKTLVNATHCLTSSTATADLRPLELGDFYGVFLIYLTAFHYEDECLRHGIQAYNQMTPGVRLTSSKDAKLRHHIHHKQYVVALPWKDNKLEHLLGKFIQDSAYLDHY